MVITIGAVLSCSGLSVLPGKQRKKLVLPFVSLELCSTDCFLIVQVMTASI